MKLSIRLLMGATVCVAILTTIWIRRTEVVRGRILAEEVAREGAYVEFRKADFSCVDANEMLESKSMGFPYLIAGTKDDFFVKNHIRFLKKSNSIRIIVLLGDGWSDRELLEFLTTHPWGILVTDLATKDRLHKLEAKHFLSGELKVSFTAREQWKGQNAD